MWSYLVAHTRTGIRTGNPAPTVLRYARTYWTTMIYIQTRPLNPLQRILATLFGIAVLAFAVMFSVFIIPIIAIVGAIGLVYAYWKLRTLKKKMAQAFRDDSVIEGEAVVVEEDRESKRITG